MFKNIDLSREVAKADYKRLKGDADLKLAALQRKDERRSREVHSPTPQPHALYTFQECEPFLE
jgi:hypothetical protein